MVKHTDGNNQVTQHFYDPRNRRTRTERPDETAFNLTYDRNNRIVSAEDPNGTITTIERDAAGRKIQINANLGDGISGATQWNHSYDGTGKLTGTSDNQGSTIVRIFDSNGNLLEEKQGEGVITYAYNQANQRIRTIYPNGTVVDSNLDSLGRTQILTETLEGQSERQIISGISRLGSLPYNIRYGNGTDTEIRTDALQRITQRTVRDSNNNEIYSRQYAYTKQGFVKEITGTNQQDSYEHDPAYRVVSQQQNQQAKLTEFSYDSNNNRTFETTKTGDDPAVKINYSTNSLSNYTQIEEQNITYDPNGSVINDGRFVFGYNSLNQITEVRNPEGQLLISYAIDPLGRRVVRNQTTPTGTTVSNERYYYDGENIIEIVNSDTNEAQATFFYIDDSLVAKKDSQGNFDVHIDPLGNVDAVTDSSENLTGEYQYDAFGKPTIVQGGPFDFGWQCGLTDSVTGLVSMMSFDYDTNTGRAKQDVEINPQLGSQGVNFVSGGALSVAFLIPQMPIPETQPKGSAVKSINHRQPRRVIDESLRFETPSVQQAREDKGPLTDYNKVKFFTEERLRIDENPLYYNSELDALCGGKSTDTNWKSRNEAARFLSLLFVSFGEGEYNTDRGVWRWHNAIFHLYEHEEELNPKTDPDPKSPNANTEIEGTTVDSIFKEVKSALVGA